MRKNKTSSFKDLSLAWLDSKSGLAESTLAAYRGEVSRMAEYLLSIGVSDINSLTRKIWWNYLEYLGRDSATPLQDKPRGLRHGSIQQASRITRSFLLWALDQEVIGWVPKLPESKPKKTSSINENVGPVVIPAGLAAVLSSKSKVSGMRDLRAHVMINLLFWGALKPAELVSLKMKALRVENTITLNRNGCDHSMVMPTHLRISFEQYFSMRQTRLGCKLDQSAPLISQLENEAPLSAWSIWSAIQDWQNTNLPSGVKITPRLLRSAYLNLLCQDGESLLQAAGELSGLKYRVIRLQAKSTEKKIVQKSNKKIISLLKSRKSKRFLKEEDQISAYKIV